MNEATAIGEAMQGGLLARAVEPHAGEDAGHTHETACLNCGTRLRGDFCHACGQHAHVHRTLGAFAHDLLHGVLHLEGKIWRTLPKLMFQPGELTRRYIAGERARFVSPLAIFLFSVFLMFAVMCQLGSPLDSLDENERQDLSQSLDQMDANIARLERERADAVRRKDAADVKKADEDLGKIRRARETLAEFTGDKPPAPPAAPTVTYKNLKVAVTDQSADEENNPSAYNLAWQAAKKNPKLLAYKLQTNAYKFSWALIIISVPFVALLFLWRRRPLYDHTVFVTYSITAMSILGIVGTLTVLAGLDGGWALLAGILFIPWHMYRQLRGGYELRRFSAIWRTVALIVFANIALGLFAALMVWMGVS